MPLVTVMICLAQVRKREKETYIEVILHKGSTCFTGNYFNDDAIGYW
jgi:hypothetical protein